MSTNDNQHSRHITDKQFSEDEAFIQSLYDDLADQNVSANEQPSKAIDDKILATAHRSVGLSVKLISNKRTWYLPLASAASVMLVFSLVINQMNDSAVQSEISFTGNPANTLVQEQAIESELDQNDLDQVSFEMLQSTPVMSAQSKLTVFEQKAVKKKQQVKPMSLAAKGKSKQQEKSLSVKRLSDAGLSVMPNSVTEPEELVVNLMTEQLYNHFLNTNDSWFFVSDEKDYYLIHVVNKDGSNSLYKLNKKTYYINSSMQKNIKARSLKELKKLTED